MPAGQPDVLLHHLRRLVESRGSGQLSDRDLLQRFATQHDEAAFAALLRRHGPMVLRACQRVLDHEHDAEDVFQATFLVLARKAASLRWHESIAGWLHEAAYRLALKVRAGTARRLARERQHRERSSPDPLADVTGRELVAVLDEELARLPEKYRTPLVLCLLEGHTRDEAARRLGYSVRTVKRRLEHGRGLLASRLTRRGLTLSAVLASSLLAPAATPALPFSLLQFTTRAAVAFAAGQATASGLVSAPVALAQGALQAMFWTKCKLLTMVCLIAAALGLGSGAVVWQRGGVEAADESAAGRAPDKSSKEDKPADRVPPEGPRADDPKMVEVWEAWVTLQRAMVNDSPAAVFALAFSPDSKTLATGGADRTVKLWDAATGKLRKVLKVPANEDGQPAGVILTMQFTPDSKRILSAGEDRVVRVWDPDTGNQENALIKHTQTVRGLAVSPDGNVAISGSEDKTIRLWNLQTGKPFIERPLIQDPVACLAISPDDKILAVGSEENNLILADRRTNKRIRECKGHLRPILSVAFSPDGKFLATGSEDNEARIWHVETGKPVARLQSHLDVVSSVAYSPDGKRLATASYDKTVILWDTDTWKEQATLKDHRDLVYAVAFSPDGKTLATACRDGTVKLWSAKRVPIAEKPALEARRDRLDKLLDELLKAKKSDAEIVEALYLATLARLPLENEKTFVLTLLNRQKERRKETFVDVLFILTSSKEFSANVEALKQRETQRGEKND
jgi:RNA polymerase sigma factor (sigma-70 family)